MKNGFCKHCSVTNLMSSLQQLDAKNLSHPSVYYIYYGSSYIINWQQLLPRSQHVVITVLRKPHRFTSASWWCYCSARHSSLLDTDTTTTFRRWWFERDSIPRWLGWKEKAGHWPITAKFSFFHTCMVFQWWFSLNGCYHRPAFLTLDRFWVVLKKAFVWVV